jgi:hypothetical protein
VPLVTDIGTQVNRQDGNNCEADQEDFIFSIKHHDLLLVPDKFKRFVKTVCKEKLQVMKKARVVRPISALSVVLL